ncbi:MAG: ATP-binding protein [Coriobacteriaceae bacterium]|nr:ATP-binding protein [Coriobacteriaceae bacterium]
MSSATHISLTVSCEPHLARIVRMTAANVAALSSMSVDRVEDIRMAAEEAFIYACATAPAEQLVIDFDADEVHVAMQFKLGVDAFAQPSDEDPTAAYADLILGSVCDSYEKLEAPARLALSVKADVDGL